MAAATAPAYCSICTRSIPPIDAFWNANQYGSWLITAKLWCSSLCWMKLLRRCYAILQLRLVISPRLLCKKEKWKNCFGAEVPVGVTSHSFAKSLLHTLLLWNLTKRLFASKWGSYLEPGGTRLWVIGKAKHIQGGEEAATAVLFGRASSSLHVLNNISDKRNPTSICW